MHVCTQLHLILFNPMDCRPPGSSVHWIIQARILGWVAISFSRGSYRHRILIMKTTDQGTQRKASCWSRSTSGGLSCQSKRYERQKSMLRTTVKVLLHGTKFIAVGLSYFCNRQFWAVMWILVWEKTGSAKMGCDILREQRTWSFQLPAPGDSHGYT